MAEPRSFIGQLVASTAGLTAFVTLLGYLVDNATQNYFGVDIKTPAAAYTATGGEFLLGSATVLVERIFITLLGGIIAAILLVASRSVFQVQPNGLPQGNQSVRHRGRYFVTMLVLLLLATKIWYFDAPVFKFHNVLLQTPEKLEERRLGYLTGGFIERRAAGLWERLISSHREKNAHESREQLERDYAINIVITSTLVIAGVMIAHTGWRILAGVIILLSVVGLPFVYATTLRRMRYPMVRIIIPANDSSKMLGIETHPLLLLGQDTNRVVIYDGADHKVHYIALAHLTDLKVENRADLIGWHVANEAPEPTAIADPP